MDLIWNEQHGSIFLSFVEKLHAMNIRYFVLRNYTGLPNINESKDVDIVIQPEKIKEAREILLQVYRQNKMEYYSEAVFGKVHCLLGMNIKEQVSIHIDLIGGYLSKGYEIFTFDELYEHTVWYKGFCVMDDFFDGVMLYVYKQFGYKHPKLKMQYQEIIFKTYYQYPEKFNKLLTQLTGEMFSEKACKQIGNKDFDGVLNDSFELTKRLRKYTWKKYPIRTMKNIALFLGQKINRVLLNYKKYARVVAVLAPDGTGKTTFLDALNETMSFYYVNTIEDNRFNIYHFRPTLLPNLGEIGEKAGVMKQNKDFTNPHRSKPDNCIGSLFRIAYYTMDYIIGWQKCVRKDVQFDKYTVFDRYSYDFIVDPLRTKLNLPSWVRKFFVRLTPQPDIVFVLYATPEVIYERKKELTLDEIERQLEVYNGLSKSDTKRFILLNAERNVQDMVKDAVQILMDRYAKKL